MNEDINKMSVSEMLMHIKCEIIRNNNSLIHSAYNVELLTVKMKVFDDEDMSVKSFEIDAKVNGKDAKYQMSYNVENGFTID